MQSGAAALQTGSSPGCAAAAAAVAAVAAVGPPGSSVHRGAEPSPGYSVAGSSALLRRRSSAPRRCLQRCRSLRNDRSQIESATESWGGPWPKRRWAVMDGWMDEEENEMQPLLRDCLPT